MTVDVLRFRLETDEDWPGAHSVTPLVNGTPLIELVRVFEAARGYEPSGGYDGIVIGPSGGPTYARQLATHRAFRRRRRVAVLGCECGETGCWPLEVTVRIDDTTVTWADFRQPHAQTWDYSGFGPFTFDKRAYRAAVAQALDPS